jgi:hypothetical protein
MVYCCLVPVKEEVAFAGSDSVVLDLAAIGWDVGVVGVCLCIAELVAEGLRCDVGEDEVTSLLPFSFILIVESDGSSILRNSPAIN